LSDREGVRVFTYPQAIEGSELEEHSKLGGGAPGCWWAVSLSRPKKQPGASCGSCSLRRSPHLQRILLWLFWRWGLENYLPGLALNLGPPDVSLPSS
jgi:hypothetical protein